jgi:large subunit ribosomal protein L9
MKIVLIEDIEKLGAVGDVVTVKAGYARNFLIPRNKAKPATASNLKFVETIKKKKEAQETKKKEDALLLADKLSSISCTINMAAGEEDKLYGSVTADIISKTLEPMGFQIDKKHIVLEEPIKKLGVYQVEVKLHPEVKANLKIWVVKE